MYAITATICDEIENDGTDATVRLRFRTVGDSCMTEDLDDWGDNDWDAGSTKTWWRHDGDHLGGCRSFRPIEGLQAKFWFEGPWFLVIPVFRLKICNLTVSFSKGSSHRRREQWELSGETLILHKDTDDDSKNWLKLVRVPISPISPHM